MTTLQKLANNIGTILLARAAMIVTPLILTAGFWITMNWADGINGRLIKLELSSIQEDSRLQDHESRLIFGTVSRGEFQDQTQKQFEKISIALDSINNNIKLNGLAISKLETIIDERVPQKLPAHLP